MSTLLLAFFLMFQTPATTPAPTPAPATQASAATATETTTLVFYRPKRYWGSALTPSIIIDGVDVARLDNGRYFAITVPAGKHKIESSMKHDPLEIEVKAGQVQYLEMVILAGTWKGGGRLIPTAEADGLKAAGKLKPLDKKWSKSDKVSFELPKSSSAD